MHSLRWLAGLLFGTLLLASPAAGAGVAHPLFSDSEMIRLTIRAPLSTISRNAVRSTDAYSSLLMLSGASPETHAIRLSARGLSRRERGFCTFPPLRIQFVQEPPEGSLFSGQERLKLVTHCRSAASSQRFVLLEYAAYRLLNILSPLSLRVRLAMIDYIEPGADAPFLSRIGFLIEDIDDAARRNGLVEIGTGNIGVSQLSSRDAARFAVFQYMIGNLDWAMNAGPPGAECCHNSKLLSAAPGSVTGLIPIPYDFDHAGIVDAPYARPPPEVPVRSVRTRRYRGFCIHNREAQVAAAEALVAADSLQAVLEEIPQLEERSRDEARAYLAGFFAAVATPEDVSAKLLRTCRRSPAG